MVRGMARKPAKRKPAARGKLPTQRTCAKLVDDFVNKAAGRKAAPAGDPREAAVAAVRAGDPNGALAALLVAWRDRPSAQLADVIATLSRRAKMPGEIRGKTASARAGWTKRAADAQPLDIGPLLASLADATSGDALKRLTHVKRWLPDPRVDAALVDLLFAVPYRATSTQPFWKQLFVLARQITDRRQLARLASWDGQGVAATMQTWLRAQVDGLLSTAGTPEAETTAMQREPDPILDQIAASLGPKISVGSRNLEALLQAIYDTPDDDAPRLVYADALLERGDPRGELINLQIAGSHDRDARRREAELLQTHGKHWLGELAPVVMSGYVFARGFLSECRIDNKHMDRIRKLVGNPAWSTVRSIEGSAALALDPVMKSLRELEFVSATARNYEGLPDSWRDLLIGTERPIEKLTYAALETDRQWENALEENQSVRPGVGGRWVYVPQVMELAALCSCSALPKLRALTVREDPDVVAGPLLGSEVIRRLDSLGFVFDVRNERRPPLELFAKALQTAPVATLAFELGTYHPTTLALERGATGYERLTMTVGPTSRSNWSETLVQEAISILDVMPPSLREVRITARRATDKQQVTRLRTAAAQRRGLTVCEVG